MKNLQNTFTGKVSQFVRYAMMLIPAALRDNFTSKVNPFVRYAMMLIAGALIVLGIMDPVTGMEFVEVGGGLITGLLAVTWYLYSEARAALLERLEKRRAEDEQKEEEA
jgi:hypothetical protein